MAGTRPPVHLSGGQTLHCPVIIDQLNTAMAGRYRIDREIGVGGMATVFLAQDLKHERQVALKVLKPELGAVLGVERFLSEIKVTANLQHPNLLPLGELRKTTPVHVNAAVAKALAKLPADRSSTARGERACER